MNLYKLFNEEEKGIIKAIEVIENKDYSKEEIGRIEHRVLDDIMSNNKKEISQARAKYRL